jgi:hypothetical protein
VNRFGSAEQLGAWSPPVEKPKICVNKLITFSFQSLSSLTTTLLRSCCSSHTPPSFPTLPPGTGYSPHPPHRISSLSALQNLLDNFFFAETVYHSLYRLSSKSISPEALYIIPLLLRGRFVRWPIENAITKSAFFLLDSISPKTAL